MRASVAPGRARPPCYRPRCGAAPGLIRLRTPRVAVRTKARVRNPLGWREVAAQSLQIQLRVRLRSEVGPSGRSDWWAPGVATAQPLGRNRRAGASSSNWPTGRRCAGLRCVPPATASAVAQRRRLPRPGDEAKLVPPGPGGGHRAGRAAGAPSRPAAPRESGCAVRAADRCAAPRLFPRAQTRWARHGLGRFARTRPDPVEPRVP